MSILDKALKDAGGVATGIIRQAGLNTLAGALNRVSIGGVSLGSLFPLNGGGSSWDRDLLSEANFQVRFSLEPSLPPEYVRSVSLGLPTLSYESHRQAGVMQHFVNGATLSDLSIGFIEDSYGTIFQMYRNLQRKAFDEEAGLYGVQSDYSQTITVAIVDHRMQPILVIKHEKCVPVSLSKYEMSVSGAKAILPVMTFKVAKVLVSGTGMPSEQRLLQEVITGVKGSLIDSLRSNITRAVFGGG